MSTNRSDQHCQPRFSNPTTEIHIRAIVCRANTNRHTQTVRLHSRIVRVRPNSLRVTPDSPVLGIPNMVLIFITNLYIRLSQASPYSLRLLNTYDSSTLPHICVGASTFQPLSGGQKRMTSYTSHRRQALMPHKNPNSGARRQHNTKHLHHR